DGIRDYKVTGVQTCALPIYSGALVRALRSNGLAAFLSGAGPSVAALVDANAADGAVKTTRELAPDGWEVRLESFDPEGARVVSRSEERRVGKGWRDRRAAEE